MIAMLPNQDRPRTPNEGAFSQWARDGWLWVVTCWYGDNAEPPRLARTVAIQTRHKTDHSKDMDVAAGESRADIGEVEVQRLSL